jgi:chromosomal replication initiator protein
MGEVRNISESTAVAPTIVEDTKESAQRAWAECLDILRTRVSAQSIKTWFEPISATSLDAGTLTLEVPSQFFYEWLEEHYTSLILETVTSVLGTTASVRYLIQEDEPDPEPALLTSQMPARSRDMALTDGNAVLPLDQPRQSAGLPQKPIATFLNPRYTFHNFIKGDSNQLARAAALAVANNPGGTSFNPLLLYGGVGLGKTHLIQAIGNHVLANNKARRVMYVSSEKFTVEFVDAIQSDTISEFSSFYRSLDVLIVDDIQFFSGKEKTQDNFFHTFNALHQLGKQIILSADKPPKELKGLGERLISRFQWGLTADIQPPDLETRIAILRKKSTDDGIELGQDVIEFLASHVTTNIRELEGCLITLLARASLENKDIDVELAKTVVRIVLGEVRTHLTIEDIQRSVCNFLNIPEELVRAKTRKQEIVSARQIAMYLSKELTNCSLKTIGLHFGGRDHSTVIHAYQTVEDLSSTDPNYRSTIQQIRSRIERHA